MIYSPNNYGKNDSIINCSIAMYELGGEVHRVAQVKTLHFSIHFKQQCKNHVTIIALKFNIIIN